MSNAPKSNSDLLEIFGGQMSELFLLPQEIWHNIAKNTLDKLDMMRRKAQEKMDRFENDPAYQEEWRKWMGQPSIPQITLPPEAGIIAGEEAWKHIKIFFSDDDLGRLYRDTAVMLDTLPILPIGTTSIAIGIILDLAAFAGTWTDIEYSDASDKRKN